MAPAVVLVHYHIPLTRLIEHCAWNSEQYKNNEITLLVICDEDTAHSACQGLKKDAYGFVYRLIVYPKPVHLFSLAKTVNFGIRVACDEGFDPILKTDVDVVFRANLRRLLDVDQQRASVPQYGYLPSWNRYLDVPLRIMKEGQGTVCLTKENWHRVQGYDERCKGWGAEDNELCKQLEALNILLDSSEIVAHIAHDGPEGEAKWNRTFNPDRSQVNRRLPRRQAGAQPAWGQP
jgi:hypothetical protein